MHRRDALGLLGAGILGALRPGIRSSRRDCLTSIGLQLYTVRRELARDFDGTLARVAEIGYREVEFAGYFGRDPAAVKAAVERVGLTAPGAHVPFESLGDDWPRTLEAAASARHQWVIVPWVPAEERRTLEAYRGVAARLGRAATAAQAAGLRFAYHNQAYDLAPLEGRVPYDVLLAETDIELELDVYWTIAGGGDPLAYFARYPGRFPCVHLKDAGPAPAHRMVDLGSGTIDFRAILARRRQAGIRHCFAEHDEPADALATARASYAYLANLEF
ncbi:MAG: sugar phosphate isomerase/epimerase family protein [Gemmatimonadales bacterium]